PGIHEEVIEAGIRAVENAEPVPSLFDFKKRPNLAINQRDVAEELGRPHGMERRDSLSRIKQRPVRVEHPVLNQEWNLELAARQIETILDTVTNQVEAREPCHYIQPGNPNGVIVIPERGGLLIVGIVIDVGREKGTDLR